jgi:hypothetical protein
MGERDFRLLSHAKALHHVLRCRRLHVGDQRSDEVHLLAGVFQDHFGVLGCAAEEIWCEDHRKVRRIHLRAGHYFGLGEFLEEVDQVGKHLGGETFSSSR